MLPWLSAPRTSIPCCTAESGRFLNVLDWLKTNLNLFESNCKRSSSKKKLLLYLVYVRKSEELDNIFFTAIREHNAISSQWFTVFSWRLSNILDGFVKNKKFNWWNIFTEEVNCWFFLCDYRMVADPENPLVLSVLHASSTAYSFSPDKAIDDVSYTLCLKLVNYWMKVIFCYFHGHDFINTKNYTFRNHIGYCIK